MNLPSIRLPNGWLVKAASLMFAAFILFAPARQARAQWATFDFLNNVGQAKNLLQLYQQYQTIRDQYRKVRAQYQLVKRNTQKIRRDLNTSWRGLREIRSVDDAMRAMNTLDYTLANIDRRLKESFPGDVPYENVIGGKNQQFDQAYGVLQSGLKAISVQNQRIRDGIVKLRELKESNEAAAGQLEATQAQTNALLYQAQSIQMLRKQMLNLAGMTAIGNVYQMNKTKQARTTARSYNDATVSSDAGNAKTRTYGFDNL